MTKDEYDKLIAYGRKWHRENPIDKEKVARELAKAGEARDALDRALNG